MPAIHTTPDSLPAIIPCWSATSWQGLSGLIESTQSLPPLALVILIAFVVGLTVALQRWRGSRHCPAPPSLLGMTERSYDLGSAQTQPFQARSSSAALPRPSLPIPTIRRSSYPTPSGEEIRYDPKIGRKQRTWTTGSLGIGITRQHTIEAVNGCRRHIMVHGPLKEFHQHCRL